MSHLLWKYFHDEDVDRFRLHLFNGLHVLHDTSKGYAGGPGHAHGFIAGSPGGYATSPRALSKQRKVSGQSGQSGARPLNTTLSKAEVNSRDHAGLTILHRAASSTSGNAISFAVALIEHPSIDLHVQDAENGWTALHRALYFGNVTVARAIIEKDNRDRSSQVGNAAQRAASSVIKIKDNEGNSPFDVYNATIARRSLQTVVDTHDSDDGSEDGAPVGETPRHSASSALDGDEVYAWGSSRNYGLGFKDQDDRQHPEKVVLKRPDHLLFRFYQEHIEDTEQRGESLDTLSSTPKSVSDLPTLISNRPIVIEDVALSKLHSAVLTTDPESNLYMCGFGKGGRLGTGDEVTRFGYVPIEDGALSGEKVVKVALGQNHSLAVTSQGSLISWGTNTYGQLGYNLPRPAIKDEEPVCATPRQIFGPLKREMIVGAAASAFHSVAHTSTSLFTWGKNEGQLGLMDSDSRSLEVQPIPRKVAASMFKASISMISAINSATVVLLANHTVVVFTNYGYNIVKFPLQEGFSNYHLKDIPLTTRYDSSPIHISQITAGGDTIGAISSRGDLFTVVVRSMSGNAATSTTNPSKIKDSLSVPQRVWSLRKGHWDGIKSVGITENGSVLVCTQAGAVWRRVQRPKIKDAFSTGNLNRKDFKFQRVPGLTNVAAVRSTTFGVYTAIRKDCDVTRTTIEIEGHSLWDELAPLLCIHGLEAAQGSPTEEDTESLRFWTLSMPTFPSEPLKRAILTSLDLEADVARHLLNYALDNAYDVEVGTTNSNVFIPAHGFILGRSSILRSALNDLRHGTATTSESLIVQNSPEDNKGRLQVILPGVDFLAVVNIVLYLYTDTVVDVWHYARHSSTMAFRYRQVRVDLMKAAGHLKLGKLESAVRLMTETQRQMNVDLDNALHDPEYYDDADTIIELEGDEVVAHSAMLYSRCPFFEGLFKGRSDGQWVADRRQESLEPVRVDLKHMQPDAFKIVLRYIYADIGVALFDDTVSEGIDEFSELVMDVMSIANELMLDRLSQICQQVIGRFVTTRNVCNLLNAIAPCSVSTFKTSALEYLCLQLESMLENHLLNDLDEDLLLELDEVVRGNQLNCLPFAKSGRAETLLHEHHPSLAEDIHEERRRRIGDMAFRATQRDDEGRLSSSLRARVGSLDDLLSASPTQDKLRRKSKAPRNAPFSPSIRPKDSSLDLMFEMDEEEHLTVGDPKSQDLRSTSDPPAARADSVTPRDPWDEGEHRSTPGDDVISRSLGTPGTRNQSGSGTPNAGPKMWSSPALPSYKLDMRDIMAQTSSSRTSALSMSISAQKAKDAIAKHATPKLSQKERKKQQQQAQMAMNQPEISLDRGDGKAASPWQVAGLGQRTSLKEVLSEAKSSDTQLQAMSLGHDITLVKSAPRRAASPDTRFAGQIRKGNKNKKVHSPSLGPLPSPQPGSTAVPPSIPQSKTYIAPAAKAEPSLQLSMSDIIGQQRREQEVIKEAVAKRSLQEIQDEQAFQEWWDQESKRAQEQEAARARNVASQASSGRGGKSGGQRGKGGRGRGRGGTSQARGGRGQGGVSATPQ